MTEDDKLKVLSYRCKHPRCRYCKYHFYPHVPFDLKLVITVLPKCAIKDKRIHPYILGFRTLAGRMCKEFGVDEDRL